MTGVADRQWAFEAHNSVAPEQKREERANGRKRRKITTNNGPKKQNGKVGETMDAPQGGEPMERTGGFLYPRTAGGCPTERAIYGRTDSASSMDSYLDSPSAPQSIMSESGDEEQDGWSIPRAGAREPEPEPEIAFSREMEESPLMSQAIASNSFTHSLSTSTSPDPEYTTSTEVRIRSSSPVFDLYDVSDEERNRVRPSHPYNRRKENKRKFEAS